MKCPICKKDFVQPTDGGRAAHFPFCSERCKLIDLGRWLDGKYQIPCNEDEPSAAPLDDDQDD